ncbi:MAG: DUF4091 domain-containing protein [Planctomycetes bacterium]|nr:DUF4091 domain-containing protein [Planctomycetota bacterium]
MTSPFSRIRFGMVAAAMVCVGAMSAAAQPEEIVYTNLLKNGGFERNFPVTEGKILNWTFSPPYVRMEIDDVHSGARALMLRSSKEGQAVSTALRSDVLRVVPGREYRVIVHAKCSAGKLSEKDGSALAGKIEWLGPRDGKKGKSNRPGKVKAEQEIITHNEPGFDWQTFEGTATAPDDAAYARLWIGCRGLVGELLLDDIKFEEGIRPNATLAVDPASKIRKPVPAMCVRQSLAPLEIDGKLDDPAWHMATRVRLWGSGAGVRPRDRTYAYVTYDPEHLCIGFRCMQAEMNKIIAQGKDRDDSVWLDDCVEVFIRTAAESGEYYQFIVNLTGVIFDAFARKSSWNGEVSVATSNDEKSWTVEMAIPFATLTVKRPTPGAVWRINLNREQKSRDELSAWAYTGGAFHRQEKFGYIVFEGPPPAAAEPKTTVAGRVLDRNGTAGGVDVWLGAERALTDTAGRFAFNNISPGKYFVVVTSPRHEPVAGSVEVTGETVLAPITLKNINPYSYHFPLPGAEEEAYAVYAGECLSPAHPDRPPRLQMLNKKIEVFASPGEYEPMTFTIFANADIGEVQVTAEELAGLGGEIPAEDMDVRAVRLLFKRTMYAEPADRLIISPETIESFHSIRMAAKTFRQIWITMKVPDDLLPGKYEGKILIQPERGPERDVKIALDVLPIRLNKSPRKRFGVYAGCAPVGRPDYARDWRAHGVETVNGWVYVTPLLDGDNLTFDLRGLERLITDVARAGLRGPIPVSCRIGYSIRDAKTRKLVRRAAADDAKRALYVQAVEAIKALWDGKKAPPMLFYPIDEPFSHGRTDLYKQLATWIHEVPDTKVFVTTTVEPMQDPAIDAVTDVRCYHGGTADAYVEKTGGFGKLAAEIAASGDEAWFYYNGVFSYEQGRGEFTRLVNGFYFWLAPYRVHMPWCYMAYGNDPFDDTDTDGRACEECIFVYPHPDDGRPIPTVQWEGYREGVDDMKYLFTLERLVAKAKKKGAADQEVSDAVQVLETIKGELLEKGPTAPKLMKALGPGDYQRMRRWLADRIVALSKALGEERE